MVKSNEPQSPFGSPAPAHARGGAGFSFGNPAAAAPAPTTPTPTEGGLFGAASSTPSSTALVPASGGFTFGTGTGGFSFGAAASAPATPTGGGFSAAASAPATAGNDASTAPVPAVEGGFRFSFGAPFASPEARGLSTPTGILSVPVAASSVPTLEERGMTRHPGPLPSLNLSSPPRAASQTDVDYKRLLTKFFDQNHPARSAEVDALLCRYKGNEPELFIGLAKDYNKSNALNEVFEARVNETLASLYLQIFHPGNATEAEQILAAYKGREAEMFGHYALKWHTLNPLAPKPVTSFSQSIGTAANGSLASAQGHELSFGVSPNVDQHGQSFGNAAFSLGEFGAAAQSGVFVQPGPSSFAFGLGGASGAPDFASSRGPSYGGLGFASGQSLPFTGGAFGAAAGTTTVPYQATSKQDGWHSIVLHSITAMPQYLHKSFEELRLEDYVSGNKGTAGSGLEASAQPSNAYIQAPPSFSSIARTFGNASGAQPPSFSPAAPTFILSQQQQRSFVSETLYYDAPSTLATVPPNTLIAPAPSSDLGDNCAICHDVLSDKPCAALRKCSHIFHDDCIDQALNLKLQCPICRAKLGVRPGTSPSSTMKTGLQLETTCAGYPKGSIVIEYTSPSSAQKDYHPNPGEILTSAFSTAYLPNTIDGKDLLRRLKYAFMHGLTFSVGRVEGDSVDTISWATVEHKTSTNGGVRRKGFPDADYFDDCHDEFDYLGVPPASALDRSGNEID